MTTSTKPTTSFALWLLLVALTLCVCSGVGCRSTDKPVEARFASVDIEGNTPGQIHNVAVEVFERSGYQVANTGLDKMIFEKEATKWSNFAYGDWGGDAPVWVRVKASIVPAGEKRFRLQCHAFMVRDRGGATEEEIECYRSAPYQKLMNEVAQRLHGQPLATQGAKSAAER